MNTTTTWTTDNRWSPGASGATIPTNAPAAYAARWIDMGDDAPADILPDRQGFAYNSPADLDGLIERLTEADGTIRRPTWWESAERDIPVVAYRDDKWECHARRAGGYIYVDAWLVPTNEPDLSMGELRPCKQYLVTVFEPGNVTDDPRNIHTILTSKDNIQPRDRVQVIEVRACRLCGAWTEPGEQCGSCGTTVPS